MTDPEEEEKKLAADSIKRLAADSIKRLDSKWLDFKTPKDRVIRLLPGAEVPSFYRHHTTKPTT